MIVGLLVGVGLLSAVVYYLVVLTEGTYLGTRIVTLLYDWSAHKYDRLKNLQYINESYFLGVPLAEALHHVAHPRVLDVATGTGRIPQALCPLWQGTGLTVGIDRSRPMLACADEQSAVLDGVHYVQADVDALCFANGAFDAVTCLEAFEFFIHSRQAAQEMHRVLRPGGVLLVSNRIGPNAWLFPRRASGRGRFESFLAEVGFVDIAARRWQVHYDLVWARKGTSETSPASAL
jgi:SAM-dependent methyltransferase